MQDTARRIAKLKLDAKLAIDEDDYVASFCPAMMKVTYEWCNGAKFSEIMKLTEMYTDIIIALCVSRVQAACLLFTIWTAMRN